MLTPRPRTVVSSAGAIAALILLVVLSLWFPPGRESLLPGAFFALLIVLSATFDIPLAGGRGSLLPTATITAFLILGIVPTAWIAFLGALLHGAIRYSLAESPEDRLEPGLPSAVRPASANATLQTTSILVAGGVYLALGGTTPFAGTTWRSVVPVAAMAGAYLVVSSFMTGIYFGTYGRSLSRVLAYEGLPLILAPVMALTYTRLGFLPFGMMTLAIIATWVGVRSLGLAHQHLERRVQELQNAALYARTNADPACRAQELDSILRTLREGVLLFDEQHRVLMANRALADLVGVAQSELLCRSLHDPRPDGSSSLLSLFDYSLRSLEDDCRFLAADHGSFKRDEVCLQPSGKLVERTLAPVYDREGQIKSWLLVLRDLSEERELDRWREETIEMLVHDLRSPLSVIVSGLELMALELEGGHTEEAVALLDLARESSQQVIGMVNDLLDVSRLESGQMSVACTAVEVEPLLQAAAKRLGPLATPDGISLEVEVEPGLPCLWVDAYVIDRVMHNLADNALKYAPDGGRVCLWARRDPEGGDARILMGVTDTGPGIPSGARSRIFEKFQQLDPAGGRRKGSGLGLFFCKLAVEAQGGEIWVESQVGHGSKFMVRLPAAVEGAVASERPSGEHDSF